MRRGKTIRVETGARLHFGLLDTAPPFGGLGVMIDRPSTIVELSPADDFSTNDAILDRVLPIAKRICQTLGRATLPAVAVKLLSCAPPHNGFGSGTQLSLAIAESLCQCFGVQYSEQDLATQIAGRGRRSAVGVHGYFGGGLIFESGSDANRRLNPIQVRVQLPLQWRLVLLVPRSQIPVVAGPREARQFARLPPVDESTSRSLQARIVDQILPAARDGDFTNFAQSIEDYNRASGQLFAAAQGGIYNGHGVADLIESLKARNIIGVGQSSWGPGVFAWCPDRASAEALATEYEQCCVMTSVASVKRDGRRLIISGM